MTSIKKANPADRITGDGALRRLARLPKQTSLPNNNSQILAQLEAARANLDRLTDQLEILADWKDDLRKRRARAQLKFELVGLDPEEQMLLDLEAKDFKRVCKALSWLGRDA